MMMMCCGNVENFLPENLVISLSTLGFFVSTSVVHIFFLCMSGLGVYPQFCILVQNYKVYNFFVCKTVEKFLKTLK